MPNNTSKQANRTRFFLPRMLLIFFALASCILVPWSIVVWQSLPAHHLDRHWNLAWSGFDISLVISLGLTSFLGLRKSGWVILPATIAGTLLLMDAWFDYLTAKQGWESGFSLVLAIFIEVPFALMAFWLAYTAGKHYIKKQ
jgi:hypothetical protein